MRKRHRIVLLLAAVALIATACGGSDDETVEGVASLSGAADEAPTALDEPAGEATQEDAEAALLEFASCLRENGVDVDDPTISADGAVSFSFRGGQAPGEADFDPEAARAARDACTDLLEGATLGFGRVDRSELEDTLFSYAECMRDNGYDMDDPDFSGVGPGNGGNEEPGTFVGPLGQIDPEDPDFIAANEACGEIFSGFGPGGTAGVVGRPGGGPGGGGRGGAGGNG